MRGLCPYIVVSSKSFAHLVFKRSPEGGVFAAESHQKMFAKRTALPASPDTRHLSRPIAWGKSPQPAERAPTSTVATNTVHIFNETKVRMPRKAMTTIYRDLLQATCSLNVIGISNAKARRLNHTYRKTNTPASVLSFPPDTGPAEIYLNMQRATVTAQKEDIPLTEHLLFLYLHALLHILGYRHGKAMELRENEYATTYIYATKAGKCRGH